MSKNEKKDVSKKGRNFAFVLYPDCPEHMSMMKYCLDRFRCVYILHDKDTILDEDGCLVDKKAHYHFIVKFESPRYLSGVLKAFDVYGIKHAEPISDMQSYLRYMLHDTPSARDKYQYTINDLQGDEQIISTVLVKDSDDLQMQSLKFLIQALEGMEHPSIKALTWFVVDQQPELWSALKSFQFLLSRIVSEMREDNKNCTQKNT